MELIIYLVCLGVGLVFTLLSAFAGHVFGHGGHVDGSGGHVEAGADFSDMPGVSAFSPTVISSFITAFGGFGIIFSHIPATSGPLVSAALAVACGGGVAGLVYAALNYIFSKTQSSSESKVAALVGTEGTIITPIPENGVGEIAYVHGGTRYTAPARTEQGTALSSGKSVKITRVVGTQFYVSAT